MAQTLRGLARELCPPLVWRVLVKAKETARAVRPMPTKEGQDLDIYWDQEMAQLLDTWGEGTAWNEIQLLMASRQGLALDIACGTGKVIEILSRFSHLKISGCDISDLLIDRALERGIARERLQVCDAAKMPYNDDQFDYSYSIGSLEHFTVEGIGDVVSEAARVTRVASFHMMPTSRSGRDEGWMKTYQSLHNCSIEWWVSHFRKSFAKVDVVGSAWEDPISVGKWFICAR